MSAAVRSGPDSYPLNNLRSPRLPQLPAGRSQATPIPRRCAAHGSHRRRCAPRRGSPASSSASRAYQPGGHPPDPRPEAKKSDHIDSRASCAARPGERPVPVLLTSRRTPSGTASVPTSWRVAPSSIASTSSTGNPAALADNADTASMRAASFASAPLRPSTRLASSSVSRAHQPGGHPPDRRPEAKKAIKNLFAILREASKRESDLPILQLLAL